MKRVFALCMALALCIASFALPAQAESMPDASAYDSSLAADDYALRGVGWTASADEVAAIEGVAVDKKRRRGGGIPGDL